LLIKIIVLYDVTSSIDIYNQLTIIIDR
jgi:hypothetical protein